MRKSNLIAGFLVFCFWACGSVKHSDDPNKPKETGVYKPYPIYTVNHDTVYKDRPRMSLVEMQRYLGPLYKYNYQNFFAPEFTKLTGIINKLSESNKGMSDYMAVTRHRTDSIAHERNNYRKLYQSGLANDLAYQKQALYLARQLIKRENEDREAKDKEIKSNTVVAVLALLGVAILIGMYISLNKKVNTISKNFAHLLNSNANA